MATRCCNHHIDCPGQGNLDYDTPIANLSAEKPDIDFFIGLNWGWDRLAPPLNRWFTKNSCLGVCESAISQADADACAARNQLICIGTCWPCPPPENPPSGPPFNAPNTPLRIFQNNPEGCSSTCPDGLTFTYTTPAGKYAAPSQLLADRMAASEACHFAVTARLCLNDLNPHSVCSGRLYQAAIRATGGTAPILFSVVSGALPPGMAFTQASDARTLIISGTCQTPADYTFTIRAEDTAGHFMQKTFTITVAGIDQSTVPDGTVGVAYSETLTALRMTLPLVWAVTNGALPGGLNLNSASGAIFGTPTTAGDSTFRISCTDGAGLTCTRDFTLHVTSTATCPTLDLTLANPDGFVFNNNWTQFATALLDGAHPTKFFLEGAFNVHVYDAATRLLIASPAVAGYTQVFSNFAAFSNSNQKIYFGGLNGAPAVVVAMDVNSYAQTVTAGYANSVAAISVDETHNVVGAMLTDGGSWNQLLILNAATMAQINLTDVTAFGGPDTAVDLTYDPVRDVFWTLVMGNGSLPPYRMRGFSRTTGAQLFSHDLGVLGVFVHACYCQQTDKLYAITSVGVNDFRILVMNPTTGAIETTILLPATVNDTGSLLPMEGRGIIYGGGAIDGFLVSVPGNTFICKITPAKQMQWGFNPSSTQLLTRSNVGATVNFWI